MNLLFNFKKIIKFFIFRPRVNRVGKNSYVMRPRWIHNPSGINIGNDFFMGRFGVLHPVVKYGGINFKSIIDIGDSVYIGGYSQLHCMNKIVIGSGCVLSEHVYISDIAHGLSPELGLIMKQDIVSKGPVIIGENCFIGFRVSVMPGVTLGKNCIVGTHSVVTNSFPDYSMVVGAPAKLIKKYDIGLKTWVDVG